MTILNWAAPRVSGMKLVYAATNRGMGLDLTGKQKGKFIGKQTQNKLADGVLNLDPSTPQANTCHATQLYLDKLCIN